MLENFESALIEKAKPILSPLAGWAKFLGILGIVGSAFMALMALFFGSIMSMLPTGNSMPVGFPSTIFSVIYLIIAVIYFFPALFLVQFGSRLKHAVATGTEDDLMTAFGRLLAHYKFVGILAIIFLSIYAIGILFGIIGGITAAAL